MPIKIWRTETGFFRAVMLLCGFALVLLIASIAWGTRTLGPKVNAAGNTYYVSTTTGNDTTGNGSQATPWKTITKSVQMMSGGDKVIISAGTYSESVNVPPTKDGTVINPTTFEAASGDTVIITHPTNVGQVFIVRADYVTLKDLIIDGTALAQDDNSQCVLAYPGSTGTSDLVGFLAENITVRNCEGHGIQISGSYNGTQYYGSGTIRNSDITTSSLMNINDPGLGSGWGSGVKVGRGGKDIVIENNVIKDNWGEGVAITRGQNVVFRNNTIYNNYSVNIYIDNSLNVDVYKNFSYCLNAGSPGIILRGGNKAAGISIGEEEYTDVPLWGNQLSDVDLYNNIVYNCSRGLTWYGTDTGTGGLDNATIAHNTFYLTDNTSSAIYFSRESGDSIKFHNNITRSNASLIFLDFSGGTYTFDYNYWVAGLPSQTAARGANDKNSQTLANLALITTPGFDPETYKIGPASTAKDAGMDLTATEGITDDYYGSVRAVPVDMGAHENVGTTYYVDASAGNNGNNGTSEATAWQTTSRVSGTTYGPGDKILFKRGQTHGDVWQMQVQGAGTSDKPIVLDAYGVGTAPILDNIDTGAELYTGIMALQAEWTEVMNLRLDNTVAGNATETAVRVQANNVVVHDLEIANVGHAISVSANNSQIYNNNIHDLKMVINDAAADNDYGAVGVLMQRGTSGGEIYGNTFTNLNPTSIDYGHDGSALEVFGTSAGVNFYKNILINCEAMTEFGSDIPTDTAQNYTFHHNIVRNSRGAMVFHNQGGVGNFGMNINNIKIENNTFFKDSADTDGFFIGFDVAPASNTFFLRNNVISYSNLINWSLNAGALVHEYNLYQRTNITGQTYTLSGTEATGSPLFVNTAGGNFRLQNGSPAINTATNLGYTSDFDGNAIPNGAAPDMGAFEYIAPAVSITLNTDGAVNFGARQFGTVVDTTASGINDLQSVTVDQGPATVLVKASNFSDGSNTWNLAASNGANAIKFEFSQNGTSWNTFSVADSNQTLVTNSPQSQTLNLYSRLTMPTTSSTFNTYAGTITLTAVAP